MNQTQLQSMAEKYKYPNCSKIFTLKEKRGYIYYFQCGHWCTDSVFEDLINIKTGLAGWQVKTLF